MAIDLFSMLYHANQNDESLYFIELCNFAKNNQELALLLFKAYCGDLSKNQKDNLIAIKDAIRDLQIKNILQMENNDGIAYSDFKKLVEKSNNFKETFQNIIYSTRIIISNKDEFVDLINNLLDNGYDELGGNFLEDFISIFQNSNKLYSVTKKLKTIS